MSDAITRCTTHHHACDCREATHAKEVADLRHMVQRLFDEWEQGGGESQYTKRVRQVLAGWDAEAKDSKGA